MLPDIRYEENIMNIYKDDTKYEALLKCSLWNENINVHHDLEVHHDLMNNH